MTESTVSFESAPLVTTRVNAKSTLVKVWQFGTLVLTALSLGMAFSHALQMPVRMRLDAYSYLGAQSLYRYYGTIGAVIEPGSVLVAAGLCLIVKKYQPTFALTLTGAICLATALVAWFIFTAPMNAEFIRWHSEGFPPGNWTRFRAQWEYSHFARFGLQLIGYGFLLGSVLVGPAREHV